MPRANLQDQSVRPRVQELALLVWWTRAAISSSSARRFREMHQAITGLHSILAMSSTFRGKTIRSLHRASGHAARSVRNTSATEFGIGTGRPFDADYQSARFLSANTSERCGGLLRASPSRRVAQ